MPISAVTTDTPQHTARIVLSMVMQHSRTFSQPALSDAAFHRFTRAIEKNVPNEGSNAQTRNAFVLWSLLSFGVALNGRAAQYTARATVHRTTVTVATRLCRRRDIHLTRSRAGRYAVACACRVGLHVQEVGSLWGGQEPNSPRKHFISSTARRDFKNESNSGREYAALTRSHVGSAPEALCMSACRATRRADTAVRVCEVV